MASLIYTYDGSLGGLLCCVFESYTRHESPEDILPEGTPSFLPGRFISTERTHAARVWRGLKALGDAAEWVRVGWLSCVPDRAIILYRFICAVFQKGPSICKSTADPHITPVFNAVRTARNEAHQYIQFLRFSDYQGILAAEISPKAMVLSLLQNHFIQRFPRETFLIHDISHKQALFYQNGHSAIREIDSLLLDTADGIEQEYRRLWRCYYDTAAVENRYNPKCRMTHMPKRYWNHMTEFQREPDGPDHGGKPFEQLPFVENT